MRTTPYAWTPEAEAKVAQAHEGGMTREQIAQSMGCDPRAVDDALRRVQMRKLNLNPLCVKLTHEERQAHKDKLRAMLAAAIENP